MSERPYFSIEYIHSQLENKPSPLDLENALEMVDYISVQGEFYGKTLYKSFYKSECPEVPSASYMRDDLVEPFKNLHVEYSTAIDVPDTGM